MSSPKVTRCPSHYIPTKENLGDDLLWILGNSLTQNNPCFDPWSPGKIYFRKSVIILRKSFLHFPNYLEKVLDRLLRYGDHNWRTDRQTHRGEFIGPLSTNVGGLKSSLLPRTLLCKTMTSGGTSQKGALSTNLSLGVWCLAGWARISQKIGAF